MNTTIKSPKKVTLVVILTAEKALPKYAHRFSPKKIYITATIHMFGTKTVLQNRLQRNLSYTKRLSRLNRDNRPQVHTAFYDPPKSC